MFTKMFQNVPSAHQVIPVVGSDISQLYHHDHKIHRSSQEILHLVEVTLQVQPIVKAKW